jgi:hypothetical protein
VEREQTKKTSENERSAEASIKVSEKKQQIKIKGTTLPKE